MYLNFIKLRASVIFARFIFRVFNFCAVKQFIYLRMNNFRALTRLTFSRKSKLWLKMFSKTLREICWNTGFPWPVFSGIRTESEILSKYGKIRIEFCPDKENNHIRVYFLKTLTVWFFTFTFNFISYLFRSSRLQVIFKVVVLKMLAKVIGKFLWWSSVSVKFWDYNFTIKELRQRFFPMITYTSFYNFYIIVV